MVSSSTPGVLLAALLAKCGHWTRFPRMLDMFQARTAGTTRRRMRGPTGPESRRAREMGVGANNKTKSTNNNKVLVRPKDSLVCDGPRTVRRSPASMKSNGAKDVTDSGFSGFRG